MIFKLHCVLDSGRKKAFLAGLQCWTFFIWVDGQWYVQHSVWTRRSCVVHVEMNLVMNMTFFHEVESSAGATFRFSNS